MKAILFLALTFNLYSYADNQLLKQTDEFFSNGQFEKAFACGSRVQLTNSFCFLGFCSRDVKNYQVIECSEDHAIVESLIEGDEVSEQRIMRNKTFEERHFNPLRYELAAYDQEGINVHLEKVQEVFLTVDGLNRAGLVVNAKASLCEGNQQQECVPMFLNYTFIRDVPFHAQIYSSEVLMPNHGSRFRSQVQSWSN